MNPAQNVGFFSWHDILVEQLFSRYAQKENMKHFFQTIIVALMLVALVILGINLLNNVIDLSGSSSSGIKSALSNRIFAPPPIRSDVEHQESFLTKNGVIGWTNTQRQDNNLPTLKENSTLDAMALAKIEDMFKNQYFAHESPGGKGVGDLAEDFSYGFVAVGENLALGNFKDDKALVDAWMASPGHRANILNGTYREIGVAVMKGTFEGKTTWLAVQHFGLSSSVCPTINDQLKLNIENNESQLASLKIQIDQKEQEISNMRQKGRREEGYYQAVEEYNGLIRQYNQLVEENKNLISIYNTQVEAFNNCMSGFLQQ